MKAIVALVAALALAGCGGDSTAPKPVNLSGTWTYSMSNLTGGGLTCSLSGMTLSLTESGTALYGTYSGGVLSCNGLSTNIASGNVVDGTVSGTAVSFDFDSPEWHQTGTISGRTMSGTVAVTVSTTSGTVAMSGIWSAAE